MATKRAAKTRNPKPQPEVKSSAIAEHGPEEVLLPDGATVLGTATEPRGTLTGAPDERLVDEPEVHTNFAPQQPSTIGEGWPIGVAAPGVAEGDTTWLNGVEYVVGEDGCITGPV